jgi:hypothetical protein
MEPAHCARLIMGHRSVQFGMPGRRVVLFCKVMKWFKLFNHRGQSYAVAFGRLEGMPSQAASWGQLFYAHLEEKKSF